MACDNAALMAVVTASRSPGSKHHIMTLTPTLTFRDVRASDLTAVLGLNNTAGASILPMDAAQLDNFYRHADYFRVAEVDGHLAGFLIALRDTTPHASSNFRWFRAHCDHFVYIDRVVIGDLHRGHGLGRMFYSDVQSYAEVRSPNLACEVFLEPRDDVSVLFHGVFGFHEAGQQVMPETGRRVSLLVKELECYAFVRDTYHDALPDLPWLAQRHLPGEHSELRTAGRA
jgi:predicted GNAT superfamily acetyltransferase